AITVVAIGAEGKYCQRGAVSAAAASPPQSGGRWKREHPRRAASRTPSSTPLTRGMEEEEEDHRTASEGVRLRLLRLERLGCQSGNRIN
ncbi:unnamed protein product, partial [Prorocentrum cordatum]